MRIIFLLLSLSLLLPLRGSAQPKHEVRAAWITAVYGLDWPQTKATSPQKVKQQQKELTDILDKLQEANFNTVLFQARTRGDVLYSSKIEPYNSILTGHSGGDPGYDPLAFAVEECHKRGMECHAWMVTIPLGGRRHVASLGKSSVTKKYPNICTPYKSEYFLNPGEPATKDYLMGLVNEVISRYDVDGVHFDYLRYPENALRFNDSRQFRKYGRGRSLQDWRRNNITEIVRFIYRGVKAQKPWVKVSTCPVGKFDDTSRYSSRGWNAFHTVYQDVVGWLNEGIQDQIYPMMYFRENHFYPFALDWKENSNGRQIIPGLGIYFLDPREGNWQLKEIERQINFIRQIGLDGEGHYRVKYVMDNTQGLYDLLSEESYTAPALTPPMPWLDGKAPGAPKELKVTTKEGRSMLTWEAATDNDPLNAPMYVVYGSDVYPVDTNNPRNIIAQRVQETHFSYLPLYPWNERTYFAVTAIDRYGNEGVATQSTQAQ